MSGALRHALPGTNHVVDKQNRAFRDLGPDRAGTVEVPALVKRVVLPALGFILPDPGKNRLKRQRVFCCEPFRKVGDETGSPV